MSSVKQNALFIILVIAVLGMVYVWYTRPADRGQEGIRRVDGSASQSRIQFLALLRTLKSISFDTSFFKDPVYQSLIDSGVEVVTPIERGQVNPFLP